MLTLITGTPGAGKSLHAVWEYARLVPGSTIEVKGEAKPRRLLSNIKNLIVDHERIDAERLNDWHEWAQAGDVIIFDEVQECWRPRAMGAKVPACIGALETHRHMGVDLILITQHPNLLDQNIRRLVNQHLHLRRLSGKLAIVYEWDHCATVSSTRNAIQWKMWWHPRAAYAMYKSAEAHTKTTARVPRLVWVAVAALAGLAYLIPNAFSRVTGAFQPKNGPVVQTPAKAASSPVNGQKASPPVVAAAPPVPAEPVQARPVVAGCYVPPTGGCACVDVKGARVDQDAEMCESLNSKKPVFDLAQLVSVSEVTPARSQASADDVDVLAFMAARR